MRLVSGILLRPVASLLRAVIHASFGVRAFWISGEIGKRTIPIDHFELDERHRRALHLLTMHADSWLQLTVEYTRDLISSNCAHESAQLCAEAL